MDDLFLCEIDFKHLLQIVHVRFKMYLSELANTQYSVIARVECSDRISLTWSGMRTSSPCASLSRLTSAASERFWTSWPWSAPTWRCRSRAWGRSWSTSRRTTRRWVLSRGQKSIDKLWKTTHSEVDQKLRSLINIHKPLKLVQLLVFSLWTVSVAALGCYCYIDQSCFTFFQTGHLCIPLCTFVLATATLAYRDNRFFQLLTLRWYRWEFDLIVQSFSP